MLADLLECGAVADPERARLPWMLVAAGVLLVAVVLYLFFGAYLPAKRRVLTLEAELRDLYAREAQLQSQIVQHEQRHLVREQQLAAFAAERDALARRLEQLERRRGGGKPGAGSAKPAAGASKPAAPAPERRRR
jgi:hypothetical protein